MHAIGRKQGHQGPRGELTHLRQPRARGRVLVRTPPQGGAWRISAGARASHDSARTFPSGRQSPPRLQAQGPIGPWPSALRPATYVSQNPLYASQAGPVDTAKRTIRWRISQPNRAPLRGRSTLLPWGALALALDVFARSFVTAGSGTRSGGRRAECSAVPSARELPRGKTSWVGRGSAFLATRLDVQDWVLAHRLGVPAHDAFALL